MLCIAREAGAVLRTVDCKFTTSETNWHSGARLCSSARDSGVSVRQWCQKQVGNVSSYYKWQQKVFDITKAQHKRFGTSSKKSDVCLLDLLSLLFNEVEVYDTLEEASNTTIVVVNKWHKKNEYTMNIILENIPVEWVAHRLEGDNLVCSSVCAHDRNRQRGGQ